MLISLSAPCTAGAEANINVRKIQFAIPSQRADIALTEFAEQADLTLIFRIADVRDSYSNPLNGEYTLEQGLDILLAGSGLVSSLSDQLVLNISAEAQTESREIRLKNTRSTRLLAAIGALFVMNTADAQNSNSAMNVMEEIVVTALKRTQSLSDIPSAVSVLGKQELEDRGMTDLHDIQFATPSLHYAEYLGDAGLTIRGIGPFGGNPGVSVVVDEVYQPTGGSARLSQMDIERIEVLRGPQGTLYGRNSNGGVVSFVSVAPTTEPEGYIRVGYADFEEYGIAGAYGAPLSENTSVRLAFTHTDSDEGWVNNLDTTQDDLMFGEETAVRLLLTSRLTEDLELNLKYAKSTQQGSLDHIAFFTDNRELTDPAIAALDITLEPLETYSKLDDNYDRNYEIYSIRFSWELPFGQLDSISAKQEYDDFRLHDGGAYSDLLFIQQDDAATDTFSQELRLSGNAGSLDWIAGLYYMDIEFERHSPYGLPKGLASFELPPGSGFSFDTDKYDTESRAFFVDATWNISEDFSFSLGARRTEDEVSMTTLHTISIDGLGVVATTCDVSRKIDDSSTTIRAALQHNVNENGMFYLSYSEGFKAGGVAIYECNEPYEPEQIDAWELGTKWTLFSGTTTLNAALFHYDYQDFQVGQVIGLTSVVRNAGDASINGLELEVWSDLNDYWSVSAGLTLVDSEYKDFVNLDGLRPELGFQQLKGNPLNGVPETSVNLGVVYSTPIGDSSSLKLRADVAYRSRTYFREFKDHLDSQEPYAVVNLNLIWETNDGDWMGRLYANNLADEAYKQVVSGEQTTGGRLGSWGMPRQVGVELTRRF